jgi:hypothetical protein
MMRISFLVGIQEQIPQRILTLLGLLSGDQRPALPAGGRDETTALWRNWLAQKTAWKRADSRQSGARYVSRFWRL